MKRLLNSLAVSCLAVSLAACSSSRKPTTPAPAKDYVVKSTGTFELRPYKEKTLSNGLKIFYIRDESLPRVSFTLLVKTGNLQEPVQLAGLNSLTANLLEQGTQSKNAIQLADELGNLGTSLDVEVTPDFTTAYIDSLSTSSEKLLKLFSDIVMNPAFNAGEIQRLKAQMIAAIQKKIDDPSKYANDRMDAYLYGEHPYSRDVTGTIPTLQKVRKQDVIRHYLSYYKPNNSSLAVVGNFSDAFETQVEEVFSKWTKRKIPQTKWSAPPLIEGLKVKLIVKKGLQQTQIRISSAGIPRAHENFIPLRLSNESLGGSFASRLNQKIRDDLGLTYSIYSGFDAKKDTGDFQISTFTKNETAGKTLEETLSVLKEYADKGASEAETKAARSQLIGQFPRAIETPDRLAFNLMVLDFMGISSDYLKNYIRDVGNIKTKAAHDAFSKTVNPANLKVLIYGDESIIPQFEKWQPEIEKLK